MSHPPLSVWVHDLRWLQFQQTVRDRLGRQALNVFLNAVEFASPHDLLIPVLDVHQAQTNVKEFDNP